MRNISLDIETYSSTELAKCGVYKYAEAPDFEILLLSYSMDGGPVKTVDIACGELFPPEVQVALLDETVIKWAFNAQFERICLSRHLGQWLEPNAWRCTMVWSAYMGLPLSLEGAGAVLGLEKQKIKEGKELIRFFSVPCKPTQANGGRSRNRPADAPEKWAQFKVYNARDVDLASDVRNRDREIDQMYNALFREFLTHMMEDPRNITACMHLHFIAKNLERMGDHATTIAEQVVYLVTGALPEESRPKADSVTTTGVGGR